MTEDRDYLLSPFTTVSYDDKTGYFILKNALYKNSFFELKKIENLSVCSSTIENKIFIQREDMINEKDRGFKILEKSFLNSSNRLGYIETTSNCPYTCKICPKGNILLEREHPQMKEEIYKKLITQLTNQTTITLHLFGDPLFDRDIYTKIKIANTYGINPSFSTNLLSIQMINYTKIAHLKIHSMTVSLDSNNSHELSLIRGVTSEKIIRKSMAKLEELIYFAKENGCIENIIVQCISLKLNEETTLIIKEFTNKFSNVYFYQKPFIDFPLTKAKEYSKDFYYEHNENIFIYNLIGEELPFKCLKPWQKKEYGVTSDGNFVPCCMSFNPTYPLGNVEILSLKDFFASIQLKEFRKKIYLGEDVGEICNACNVQNQKKFHSKVGQKLERFKDYCLNHW